ncbi:MAG: hypothetical protein NXI22_11985 [bacterium]|nr:hypothetical protein [bacterium]
MMKTFTERLAFGLLLAIPLCLGCGGGAGAPIEGSVTVNGAVIDQGSITFIPTGEGIKGGASITEGKYVVPAKVGLAPGSYKVEIRWNKKTGKKLTSSDTGEEEFVRKEGLPAKFNSATVLTAEIGGGSNTEDFELTF